jgi:hypothetical protein
MHPQSITNLFTPESLSVDGSVRVLEPVAGSQDRLYLTNQCGRKLLQIVIKDEPVSNICGQFAQIKLIPYGIRRARVYNDKPSDPSIEVISQGIEFTYHGGPKGDAAPKVHLKAANGYKTLVDCSLSLSSDIPRPAPLFTLEPGYEYDKPLTSRISKRAHVIETGHHKPVRFDLYLAGKGFDLQAFVESMYFHNLFSTPDFLIRARNCPLNSGLIIAPILLCEMGRYTVFVRRSLSRHAGRPFLQFYNNADYFEKLMNRRTAWIDGSGQPRWSTMEELGESTEAKA